jgi:biopolymer transport protein ExbD
MALGGPSSDNDDEFSDGVFADINITPLTDIFLVLLIIFMVTSSVIVNSGNGAKSGLKVSLPQGGSSDVAVKSEDLSVAILSDGQLVLGGVVVTREQLEKSLAETKAKNPETLVIVQADEGVTHGKVVEIMELAKAAGLAQLAIGVREGTK